MGLGAGLGTPSSLHPPPPPPVPTVRSWLLFLQGALIVICHVYERVCISGQEGTQTLWRTVGMGPPWVGPPGPPSWNVWPSAVKSGWALEAAALKKRQEGSVSSGGSSPALTLGLW